MSWKVIFIFLLATNIHVDIYAKNVKKFCLKHCFYQCKENNQAVKNCKTYNSTMVSFQLKCECRNLIPGETLPSSPPNYIIKTPGSN